MTHFYGGMLNSGGDTDVIRFDSKSERDEWVWHGDYFCISLTVRDARADMISQLSRFIGNSHNRAFVVFDDDRDYYPSLYSLGMDDLWQCYERYRNAI